MGKLQELVESRFRFTNLRYGESHKGINVFGEIRADGVVVGYFYQDAYCVCCPVFDNLKAKSLFLAEAKQADESDFDYAERLLLVAEAK